MDKINAEEFCSLWLPAWTGNDPEKLAGYYSDDAFYSDHLVPNGVKGREQLLAHFKKCLGQNPNWVWTQIEAIPMEGGFLNKWRALIPVGKKVIECIGVCLVQFDARGKIKRNETYFDPREVVAEIIKFNVANKAAE